jgi:hypothetical protein
MRQPCCRNTHKGAVTFVSGPCIVMVVTARAMIDRTLDIFARARWFLLAAGTQGIFCMRGMRSGIVTIYDS